MRPARKCHTVVSSAIAMDAQETRPARCTDEITQDLDYYGIDRE
jgi:hypothetical protein